jgi:undecaprenyl-diphosphatase
MKNAFHISRPLDGLIALNSWSFPSGHATVATAFFFATGYTYFSRFERVVSKILLIVGCLVGVCVISASRVYLGAHFALDVLAGTALGLLCVSLTILFFNILLEEEKWRHRKLFGKIVRLTK